MPSRYSSILLFVWLLGSCSRNSATIDRSVVALRLAKESQDRSLMILDRMATQAGNSAKDEQIAESANVEIQRYAQEERKQIQEERQAVEAAQQSVADYRAGNGKKSKRQIVEDANRVVLNASKTLRILEKKTEVIVDFLNNETFSKSEIGALFSPGEYHLIPGQLKEGERLFTPIVQKLYTFANKYNNSFKSLKGEIIVTGYSDAMPVEPGSQLYADLAKRLQTDSNVGEPTTADLNQKLSEMRALAVKNLLEKIIGKRKGNATGGQLPISVTVLGRGEQIPRGLPVTVAKNDQRRRVVTFYWVVLPSL